MNKNKITCGTIFVCSLCVLLIGLTILIGGEGEAQKADKILSVAGNDFAIPPGFPAVLDTFGYISFSLNVATFQPHSKGDMFNFLNVDVLPAEKHPGSFFFKRNRNRKRKLPI